MRVLGCFVSLASLAAWCGCGPRVGPTIDPPAAPVGPVGVELTLLVHGSSPDGRVAFDFGAPDLPDLKTRALPATLTNYAEGEAAFRWLPIAGDEGRHEIDLIATGNGVTTQVPTVVTVTAGEAAPPVFREPAGEGTTLELVRGPCAAVDVIVDDAGDAAITVALAPPLVANARLDAGADPGAAQLVFCPSPAQLAATTIFPITLAASAGGATTQKIYTVVVRPIPMVTCTTAPPAISTAPLVSVKTSGDLHVAATLSDDLGVVGARLLWTTTAPADPKNPDFTAFAPIALARSSGDALSGQYDAFIPNPVVASPPGTAQTIYYALVAADDDPPYGCAHTVRSPISGAYSFVVTNP